VNENTLREAFGSALQAIYEQFRRIKGDLEVEYARATGAGERPADSLDDLLERSTRRFLIDPTLRALDWNPDATNALIEEARAHDPDGARLFLDYLGISPREREPVMIVEAKRYEVTGPRRPNRPTGGSAEAAELISKVLALRKLGRPVGGAILADWAAWLDDVRSYVASFNDLGKATLKRVVISCGQWLIVFKDPIGAFITPGAPSERDIHCFLSPHEIVNSYRLIYDLLYRKRLVDTLTPAIGDVEALSILSAAAIEQYFRGVVVASKMTGAARGQLPTRIVYPALLVTTANRIFAVVS